jgi:hypothetical protein
MRATSCSHTLSITRTVCAGGGGNVLQYTDWDGVGEGRTTLFQVFSRSKEVYYYNDGPGSLKITLHDWNTGKKVETLVSGKGEMEGTTYINYPGRYYLQLNCPAKMIDDFPEGGCGVEVE